MTVWPMRLHVGSPWTAWLLMAVVLVSAVAVGPGAVAFWGELMHQNGLQPNRLLYVSGGLAGLSVIGVVPVLLSTREALRAGGGLE